MTPPRGLTLVATMLSAALFVVACDGDEATPEPATAAPETEAPATAATATLAPATEAAGTDAPATQAPAASLPPADGSAAEGGVPGTALLTVGAESWSFDGIFCASSPEEAGNDRVSFTMSAFGQLEDGTRTQLDASIQDRDAQGRMSGDGTIHSVSLNDVEDFEDPAVAWEANSAFPGTDFEVVVDGKNVSAEAEFDDGRTQDLDPTPGTLVATCP